MQLVVVSAVRNAVSAATNIFAKSSIIFVLFIADNGYWLMVIGY